MKLWEKLVNFLEEERYAVLSTVEDSKPFSRMMVFITLEKEGKVYTATSSGSNKIRQIKKNNNVYFYAIAGRTCFSGEGTAKIVEDRKVKEKVLETNPGWKKFYSVDDEKFALIEVSFSNLEFRE